MWLHYFINISSISSFVYRAIICLSNSWHSFAGHTQHTIPYSRFPCSSVQNYIWLTKNGQFSHKVSASEIEKRINEKTWTWQACENVRINIPVWKILTFSDSDIFRVLKDSVIFRFYNIFGFSKILTFSGFLKILTFSGFQRFRYFPVFKESDIFRFWHIPVFKDSNIFWVFKILTFSGF